jgi:hypothetical protein
VVGNIGVHRTDDGDIVDAGCDMREKVTDFNAAFSIFLEGKGRPESGPGFAFGRQIRLGERLAMKLVEHRLGIEGIDVRRAAIHEEMDDALRLGGKMRRLGRERMHRNAGASRRFQQAVGRHEAREAEGGESHATAGEEFAAGKG